jgi:hypothetical protein
MGTGGGDISRRIAQEERENDQSSLSIFEDKNYGKDTSTSQGAFMV